jgi:hypothetical protein
MRVITKNNEWFTPIRNRTKAHVESHRFNKNISNLTRRKGYQSLNKLYDKPSGIDLEYIMMDKTVFIAQTAMTLKNSNLSDTNVIEHDKYLSTNYYTHFGNVKYPIPAYVIHNRKGAYAKAIEILENQGFKVIEAEAPEKKEYIPKSKTEKIYAQIMPKNLTTWESFNVEDKFADPTHLHYATLGNIKEYNYRERPSSDLIFWFLKKNPKTVIIHNKITAENLISKGVIPMTDAIVDWYDKQSSDVNRMTNIIRAAKIAALISIPEEMLKNPIMQLELGMEPVDPKDTDFWYESNGYNHLMETEYYSLAVLKKRVKDQVQKLWNADPKKDHIIKMGEAISIINEYKLSSLWTNTLPKDRDALVNKTISTMKLFS